MDLGTTMYHSPFDERYASKEMNHIFSDDVKFSTWRKLWVALAKTEQQLGWDITDEQIAEMEKYVNDINYDVANAREREIRHDVMAHVYAFGQQAKSAEGIIHLGATSCYVTDNTDILNMRDAITLVQGKLLGVIQLLADFASKYRDMPTLGQTHYQSAALVTVGKRACIWLQNFVDDFWELDFMKSRLKMLGCRGATGTADTFMKLFDGDEEKCTMLETLIAKQFGFARRTHPTSKKDGSLLAQVFPISGQTYPRNLDYRIISALAAIGASAYKMAQDIRLLQHDKEVMEPFSKNQVGSSAMAYKQNPMRDERIDSIARYLSGLPIMAWQTAAVQMLERTLDDSAARRIYIPDAFRATDAILILCANVVDGLVVNPGVISSRMDQELPFIATEGMIMKAAEQGADRQLMHERIREHSLTVKAAAIDEGLSGPEIRTRMVQLINDDSQIPLITEDINDLMDPMKLIGCCPSQVENYLNDVVYPLLHNRKEQIILDKKVSV